MSKSKRLDNLNVATKGMRLALTVFVTVAVLCVAGGVTYLRLQQSQARVETDRKYIEDLYARSYNKEDEVLRTFSKDAGAVAHSSYRVEEDTGVNYLKMDNFYLRSSYDTNNGNVSRNDLIEEGDLDVWLTFDELQSRRLQLIQDGKEPSGLTNEIEALRDKYPALGN